MTRYNKIAAFGCTVALAGLLVCIYFYFFTPVYAGASGAGMAGLGSAFGILAGMIALALGSVIAVSEAWERPLGNLQDTVCSHASLSGERHYAGGPVHALTAAFAFHAPRAVVYR